MKQNKLLLIIILLLVLPFNVSAKSEYNTIAEMRQHLAELKAEKKATEDAKRKTQGEINQNQNNIKSANDDIVNAQNKVTLLNDEIANNKKKIESLKNETTELLRLYQKLTNENVYVKYITGATSMSELIMRLDAITQLTKYNNKKINEMEQLVISNTKMQKELDKYQKDLDKKIVQYEAKISNLNADLKDLVDEYEDYDSQILSSQQMIDRYVKLGCKENQPVSTCSSKYDTPGWTRPLNKGIVTSAWGYRFHPTQHVWKFHNGIDIGVSEGNKVYSSANGVVSKINNKSSCGGNMVYVEVNVLGKEYTVVYMHLLTINVRLNQEVNTNTLIGLSGGGASTGYDRCSTGAHLHYGVSTGHYPSKISYSKYISNSINPPNFPPKGSRFYSR